MWFKIPMNDRIAVIVKKKIHENRIKTTAVVNWKTVDGRFRALAGNSRFSLRGEIRPVWLPLVIVLESSILIKFCDIARVSTLTLKNNILEGKHPEIGKGFGDSEASSISLSSCSSTCLSQRSRPPLDQWPGLYPDLHSWVRLFVVPDASRGIVITQKYTKTVKECQVSNPRAKKTNQNRRSSRVGLDSTRLSGHCSDFFVSLLMPLLFTSHVSSLLVHILWPKFQNARSLKGRAAGKTFSEGKSRFWQHFPMWSVKGVRNGDFPKKDVQHKVVVVFFFGFCSDLEVDCANNRLTFL